MQTNSQTGWPTSAVLFIAAVTALGACAYGLEPDRSALTGGEGGAGGAPSAGSGGAGVTSSSNGNGSSASSAVASSSSSSNASSSSASSSSVSSSLSSVGVGGAPPTGLVLEYRNADTNALNNEIKPQFNVVNNTIQPVPVSALSIRYWYTIEPNGSQTQQFHCDYAKMGSENVSGTFGAASGEMTDHYLQIQLAGAASLLPGQSTGEIQARFNKSDFANFDETNDYSYDPTKLAFAPWDKVGLYYNGALVWGMEP